MYRDPSEFRKRVEAYKNGKSVREIYGLPGYAEGTVGADPELDMIKKFEQWRDKTYLDSKNIPTIGWGFTDTSLVSKGKMSREEGDRYLLKIGNDAKKYLRNKLGLRIWDNLDTATKAALLSYHHNYPAGFGDNTRFMKHWRAGRYNEAVSEIDAGMNDPTSPGLKPRRLEEQATIRKDSFLFPKIKPQKPADALVLKPDVTRVAPVPTIQQLTVPSTWMLQATELPSHTFVLNFEMAKPLSIQKLVDTIEEYTPTWDRFKNAYADGKLPRYQNGLTPQLIEDIIVQNQGTILQGHRWSPLSDYANSTWRDYNKPFFLLFIEGGLGNAARGLLLLFESWNKEVRGIADITDHANVLLDILTGAGGKITKDSSKELIKNTKKAVKKAINPTKASTKKMLNAQEVSEDLVSKPKTRIDPKKHKQQTEYTLKITDQKTQKYNKTKLPSEEPVLNSADFPENTNINALYGPEGMLFSNKIVNNDRLMDIAVPHEFKHYLQQYYNYTPELAMIMERAFPFSEKFIKEHPDFNFVKEGGAMLSELEYEIGKRYGFPVGKDFEDVVNRITPAEIEDMASKLSVYNRDASEQRIKHLGMPDVMPLTPEQAHFYNNFRDMLLKVPVVAGGAMIVPKDKQYKNGKLPGYKDGTKMQWDVDTKTWRQVMDDPYADVFNNLVVTPRYARPRFEYETNPNYQQPDKNEVVRPDETLWTRQQVEKANNTRTWRSDAADAMKYVQYISDAAGLLYGMTPGIKQRAAKAIYRNIVPASYKDSYLPGGKKQEVVNAIKDFFTPKKLDLDNSAYRKWEQENLSLFFTDTDPVAARDEIYRKYLGLQNDDFYYIKNVDGTYSHNLANHEPHDIVTIINNTYNNDKPLSGKNQVLPDMLNSAGGLVNTSLKKVNDVLARFKYNDVWDVNPFKDADRVGNVFPKKLLNKYSHIEKLASGEEVRVWNKDVPWFIKKLQNFELSDFTNGAPVPVKTDINVRLLNPEEYSYTKKLTDTQIIEKMKLLGLSNAYDLYGDAISDGIISKADWEEIELNVVNKVYDRFYKDPNKYRKMFVYNVNHPLKTLFDWYGPFVLLRGYKDGKISIKPSKRGTFTAAAKKHGASVREFESRVLKNPEKYSTAMVKKARFSRNARSFKK